MEIRPELVTVRPARKLDAVLVRRLALRHEFLFSDTCRNRRKRLNRGVVPSPTPIVGMFGDSISVILLPA